MPCTTGSRPDGRAAVDDVEAAIDLLTDALLSHLAYEERELVEPLARLGLLVQGWRTARDRTRTESVPSSRPHVGCQRGGGGDGTTEEEPC